MTLGHRRPVLAGQLATALRAQGLTDLAAQVSQLGVHDACGCDDSFCQSFFTAPQPPGEYGPRHTIISLDQPWAGTLNLDVVGGQIIFVEVLDRAPLD